MQGNMRTTAGQLIAGRSLRKKLQMTAAILGLLVLFTVFYMLSLPASTLEGTLICESGEHIHVDGCYKEVLICGNPTEGEEAESPALAVEILLVCDLDEGHSHGENCYSESITNLCGLEETEVIRHEHSGECYQESQTLICEEDHEHETDCYETESNLICTETGEESETAGHIHSEECFAVQRELICPEEEVEGHFHEDDCYTEMTAGGGEEIAEHVHTAECYGREAVCGYEEHVHSEDCYYTEAMGIGIAPVAFDMGASFELADFLSLSNNGVAIKDKDGNPIGDTVYVGETYQIIMTFSEQTFPSRQFKYTQIEVDGEHKDVLIYQLPDIVKIITEVVDEPLKHPGTNLEIGYYSIDKDGFVTVWFKDGINVDGTENPGRENYIYEYDDVNFEIILSALLVNDGSGESQEIKFSDEVSVVVKVEKKDAGLEVSKAVNKIILAEHLIQYAVSVKAVGDTVHNITLEDIISYTSTSATPRASSDFSLDLAGGHTALWTEIKKDGDETPEYPKGPYHIKYEQTDAGSFSISFVDDENNPIELTLKEGEYFVIIYAVKLNDSFFWWEGGNAFATAKHESNILKGKITNTVTAEGVDDDDEPVDGTGTVVSDIHIPYVSKKDGERITIEDTEYIKWTATIGDGYFDFGDDTKYGVWRITDKIAAQMKFATELPITITGYQVMEDGKPQATAYKDFNVSWENCSVDNNGANNGKGYNSFSWKIPKENVALVYKVEYYTNVPDSIPATSNDTVKNVIALDNDAGVGSWDDGFVRAPVVGDLVNYVTSAKTGQYLVGSDGKLYFEYTVSLEIPKEVYSKQFYVNDSMQVNYWSSITGDILGENIYFEDVEVIFELKDADGKIIPTDVYLPKVGYNGTPATVMYFLFGLEELSASSATNTTNSKWLVEEDSFLTITYKISFDSKIRDQDCTVAELMQTGNFTHMYNNAKLMVDEKGRDNKHTLRALIRKEAVLTYWGKSSSYKWIKVTNDSTTAAFNSAEIKGVTYTVTLRPHLLRFESEESREIASLIFEDDYDERLVYAPNTMRIAQYPGRGASGGSVTVRYAAGSVINGNTHWSHYNVAEGWKLPRLDTTSHVDINMETSKMILDFAKIDRSFTTTTIDASETKAVGLAPIWMADSDCHYTVTYVLTFPENEMPADVNTYENTAIMKIRDGQGETYEFSADADITFGTPVVVKEMEYSGQIASVTIVINPDGYTLATGGLLQIDDIMTGLTLYDYSLVVKVDGVPQTLLSGQANVEYGYTVEQREDGQNIHFWLPDGKPISITYDALIDGNPGQQVEISNAVTIKGTGYGDNVFKEKYQVTKTEGMGAATVGNLKVSKQDALNPNRYLEGAVFEFYRAIDYAESGAEIVTEGSHPDIVTDGLIFRYYVTETTDVNGLILFEENGVTKSGSIWLVREIEAPTGYMLMEEDIIFYMKGNNGEAVPARAQTITDAIYIPNTPYHTLLPNTGGSGTSIYYAIGLAILCTTGVVILLRSRKGGRSAA